MGLDEVASYAYHGYEKLSETPGLADVTDSGSTFLDPVRWETLWRSLDGVKDEATLKRMVRGILHEGDKRGVSVPCLAGLIRSTYPLSSA